MRSEQTDVANLVASVGSSGKNGEYLQERARHVDMLSPPSNLKRRSRCRLSPPMVVGGGSRVPYALYLAEPSVIHIFGSAG